MQTFAICSDAFWDNLSSQDKIDYGVDQTTHYTTLQLWETGSVGHGLTEIIVALIIEGGVYAPVDIVSTPGTLEGHAEIHVHESVRHKGIWDDSKATISGTSSYMVILNTNSKYSVISGLQIDSLSTGIGVYNLSLNSKIYNCIIKNGNWGIYCSENAELITNCIFYNQKRAPISPAVGSIKILNCTAYNYNSTNYVGAGFVRSQSGSLVTMINCVGKAHEVSLVDDFYNSQAYTAESDYNCSEDDSAPGANSIHLTTDGGNFDFVNVNSGSEHFMLKSTSACVDAGINVTEVTTDIYGTVRPINGISDIGAYEYDPSIGLPVPYTIQNLITTSRLTIEEEDGTVVLPPLQVNSADISGSLEYFTDKTLILKVRRSSANLGDGIRYKPFKQAVPLTSEGLIAYVSQELDEVLK